MKKSKILVIYTRFPYPPIGGDRIRIYNMMKLLTQNFDIDLLVINEGNVCKNDIDFISKLGIRPIIFEFLPFRHRLNAITGLFSKFPIQTKYYYFKIVADWIDNNYRNYELILCNHIRTTEYISKYPIHKIRNRILMLAGMRKN